MSLNIIRAEQFHINMVKRPCLCLSKAWVMMMMMSPWKITLMSVMFCYIMKSLWSEEKKGLQQQLQCTLWTTVTIKTDRIWAQNGTAFWGAQTKEDGTVFCGHMIHVNVGLFFPFREKRTVREDRRHEEKNPTTENPLLTLTDESY